ncbi:DNA-binding protein [Rhizobacter sp. SG703]|uniref:DNA-binding protein n=1 Tax=Rhizobacter sp. SG703 TaxID=2587140 RepID=UPI001445A181|nr:DNA-binding protein [Rhizobacter sp. SG703]
MAASSAQPLPLEQERRANLPTADAAFHLNRSAQTLRLWACKDLGPVHPLRINGRLAWPTADLRRVLGIESAQQ